MVSQIIQNVSKQKELFIAVDHGLSFPGLEGLERPFDILNIMPAGTLQQKISYRGMKTVLFCFFIVVAVLKMEFGVHRSEVF